MTNLIERLRKQATRGTYMPDGPNMALEAAAHIHELERDRRASRIAADQLETDYLKTREALAQSITALRYIEFYMIDVKFPKDHHALLAVQKALASQSDAAGKRESIPEETARVNREYAAQGVIGRCPKHDYVKTVSAPTCPLCDASVR